MCGIAGYTGCRQAAPLILEGLSHLEYRGYDSAGIAVRTKEGVQVVKARGRLKNLRQKTEDGAAMDGCCGIGHTRWATHGEPSENNAHPHVSTFESVTLVHNGIIENAGELRVKLEKAGFCFHSQTDTEVAANLIEYYRNKYRQGSVDAIARAMIRIRGSYAFGILFEDEPDILYAARLDSPLVIGRGQGECFIASDASALIDQTRQVYYIDNREIARLSPDSIEFFSIERERLEKESEQIEWQAGSAGKNGFEHYMMKEIHEQPLAIERVLDAYVSDGTIVFDQQAMDLLENRAFDEIEIVACGSAWHAGLVAREMIETLAKIPVRVELASEFRSRQPLIDERTLTMVISQSGETADTLAALRKAKSLCSPVLAIVNVPGSSIAREADGVIATLAGPEIAVATTKAYSCQLIVCDLIALHLALGHHRIDDTCFAGLLDSLALLPEKIETIVQDKERLQRFASRCVLASSMFFIGRGLDFAAAMEASLKMKEISYIHSEAYAAGELKHGTISLMEPGVLVFALVSQPDQKEKMISAMREVSARGASLASIGLECGQSADWSYTLPPCNPLWTPSLSIIPLQLLAYYVAAEKGLDIDCPRNLAKSVTVE